jgi:hypothetical protein
MSAHAAAAAAVAFDDQQLGPDGPEGPLATGASARQFAAEVDAFLAKPLDTQSNMVASWMSFRSQVEATGRPPHEVAGFARAERRLDDFIALHWPALTAPAGTLNSVQCAVVQLLATHLARHSLGTSQVIPHILDYVRAPNTAHPRTYRQIEAQTAHAAFGHAQLAHAATTTPTGPAPASAPAHKRARAEDAEQVGAI